MRARTAEPLVPENVGHRHTPDYEILNDLSRPLRERFAEFSRTMFTDDAVTDKADLAVSLEFIAALLRSPDALRRYSANLEGRLEELAAADDEQPLSGTTPVEAWAIGHALLIGLQVYQFIAPGILTPAVFARACELLAGLYPEG